MHAYVYAEGNPLKYTDESGLFRVDFQTGMRFPCISRWACEEAPKLASDPRFVESMRKSQFGTVSAAAVRAALRCGSGPIIEAGNCYGNEGCYSGGYGNKLQRDILRIDVENLGKCCDQGDYAKIARTVLHELWHYFRPDVHNWNEWTGNYWKRQDPAGWWERGYFGHPYGSSSNY